MRHCTVKTTFLELFLAMVRGTPTMLIFSGISIALCQKKEMSDDTKITGPEREINLSHENEVQDWARKFGVTASEIRRAVKEVGNNAREVEAFLENAKRT